MNSDFNENLVRKESEFSSKVRVFLKYWQTTDKKECQYLAITDEWLNEQGLDSNVNYFLSIDVQIDLLKHYDSAIAKL